MSRCSRWRERSRRHAKAIPHSLVLGCEKCVTSSRSSAPPGARARRSSSASGSLIHPCERHPTVSTARWVTRGPAPAKGIRRSVRRDG
eukprot:1176678-Prorocentrum_minimum.AAC.1